MSDDWRQKLGQRLKEKQAGNSIKIDVGDNCLRVLPDKKDLLPDGRLNPKGIQHMPVREYRVHRDVGPDKAYGLRCGIDIETGTGKCWICNVGIKSIEETKPDYAYAMRPTDEFVVNASRFDPDTKRFSLPKPWFISSGGRHPLSVRVGSKIKSERKDYLHPIKGYNINISRVGTGFKGPNATSYPEVEGDEHPTQVPLSVTAAVKDLDAIIPQYDEEKQKRAFYGKPDEDDEGGRRKTRRSERDEDDEPVRRRKQPPVNDDEAPADAEYGAEDSAPEDAPEDEAPLDDTEEVLDAELLPDEEVPDEEVPDEEVPEDVPAEDELPEDELPEDIEEFTEDDETPPKPAPRAFRPASQSAPKPGPRPTPKPAPRPAPRPTPKPAPRPAPKPAPRPTPKPAAPSPKRRA